MLFLRQRLFFFTSYKCPVSSHFIMLFSLNVYTFFQVFKTFEMEKKRFENKIRKLRHCLHFTKSKTFSFSKIKHFRNKRYIKSINGVVLIRAGEGRIIFQNKLSGGRRLFGTYCTIDKNWRSQNLSEKLVTRKENLKKCTNFEEQKDTRYIQGNVYLALLYSDVFHLQNRVSDFF